MHSSYTRLIATLLCLTFASSCATAKFAPGKPVTRGGPFGTFVQGGETVSESEVRDYLETQPETEYKAKTSKTWRTIGLLPGLAGGFLIGYNLVNSDRTSDTGLWIGIGLAAVAAACGIYSESLLTSAVDTYNQKLVGAGKKSALQLEPVLTARTGDDSAAALGLALRF